jgi:hypothetical protein
MNGSNFPRDALVTVGLIARLPLSPHVQVGAESVFILEHYFGSIAFASIREAASNAYPDREVRNKTTVHRLATKLRDTVNMYDRQRVPLVEQFGQAVPSPTPKNHQHANKQFN